MSSGWLYLPFKISRMASARTPEDFNKSFPSLVVSLTSQYKENINRGVAGWRGNPWYIPCNFSSLPSFQTLSSEISTGFTPDLKWDTLSMALRLGWGRQFIGLTCEVFEWWWLQLPPFSSLFWELASVPGTWQVILPGCWNVFRVHSNRPRWFKNWCKLYPFPL